jgi:hypothetical protein
MSETENAPAQEENVKPVKLIVIDRPEGIQHVYANNLVVAITGYDVTIWCSKLVRMPQHNKADEPMNQLERRATLTMSWAEAKFLRNSLSDTIEKFEALNGEINPAPKIPQSA